MDCTVVFTAKRSHLFFCNWVYIFVDVSPVQLRNRPIFRCMHVKIFHIDAKYIILFIECNKVHVVDM